jgi:hypothetical protein
MLSDFHQTVDLGSFSRINVELSMVPPISKYKIFILMMEKALPKRGED